MIECRDLRVPAWNSTDCAHAVNVGPYDFPKSRVTPDTLSGNWHRVLRELPFGVDPGALLQGTY